MAKNGRRAARGSPRTPEGRPRPPKSAPRGAPRAPKSGPRAPQERPKSTPRAPKNSPRAPNADQRAPKDAQRAPKSTPRAPQERPRSGFWTFLGCFFGVRTASEDKNTESLNLMNVSGIWPLFWWRSASKATRKAYKSQYRNRSALEDGSNRCPRGKKKVPERREQFRTASRLIKFDQVEIERRPWRGVGER